MDVEQFIEEQAARPKRVMKLPEARAVARQIPLLEGKADLPITQWAGNCHSVSLALVKSGVFGRSRVARGTYPGIASQHSWIVLGDDVYGPASVIVDPTALPWITGEGRLIVDYARNTDHVPHGKGSIFRWAGIRHTEGAAVELTPKVPLSRDAQTFLAVLGPMSVQDWYAFATHAPVQGWPAAEILTAINDTFPAAVPVDKLGMVTDLNPKGLYW